MEGGISFTFPGPKLSVTANSGALRAEGREGFFCFYAVEGERLLDRREGLFPDCRLRCGEGIGMRAAHWVAPLSSILTT